MTPRTPLPRSAATALVPPPFARSLIRAAEIWTLDPDGYLLAFDGGLYGDAREFEAVSRALVFGRGEGLPGRAWEEGQPVLLRSLHGASFRRSKAAARAGLAAAAALPFHHDGQLRAVVVFFFGADAPANVAVEAWQQEPGSAPQWVDGYYGSADHAIEPAVGRLADAAWSGASALRVDGDGARESFLQELVPDAAESVLGIAIPCLGVSGEDYLLTLIGPSTTPLARRIECWSLDDATQSLQRAYGYAADEGQLRAGASAAEAAVDEALLLDAFATALPALRAGPGDDGALGTIALPIVRDGAVAEIVSLTI